MRFERPSRPVDRVFIHCSASDNPDHDDISVIRQWHLARGWTDVGYHAFIRKDGTFEWGRPLSRLPAAQKGHNKGTIAVCLHGLAANAFTDAQFDTLTELCGAINAAYRGRISFHGHCEVSPKTCPVFDYKAVLGLDRFQRMP